MIKKFIKKVNQKGFVATLQEALQKMIGIRGYKEELDTLYYFLNVCHAPSTLSPATDQDLRILQQCDVQLLRIVTAEAKNMGLSYWLDFGTLLGAVRHKGFIPWDDDMDIAMPRADYNRALVELRKSLAKYDITLHETDHIGIGYKHEKTGIWLDIFAVDNYYTTQSLNDVRKELQDRIKKCRKSYQRHSKIATSEWRTRCREKYIGEGEGKCLILYHQSEFKSIKDIIHEGEFVMPLGTIEFENYVFDAPSDVDAYLKVIYGNRYMGFPKKGLLHHDLGRGPLSSWAKRNGVDMNEIYGYLKNTANFLDN